MMNNTKLKSFIRNISDFPKPGIEFKDITPLLANPEAFTFVINQFCQFAKLHNVTAVVAAEARGFIFGCAVAYQLKIKFVPARKPNKLPFITHRVDYQLEYTNSSLEINQDSLNKNDKVIIIDDLIATSGTINACIKLISQTPATVSCVVVLILLKEQFQNDINNIPLLSLVEF